MPAPWASRALPAVPNQYSTSVDGGRHGPIPPAPVPKGHLPALSPPSPLAIPGSPDEHDASARPASDCDCMSDGGKDDCPISLWPSKDLLTVLPAPPTRPKAFSSRPPGRRPLPRPRRPPPPVAFTCLLDLAASIRARLATSWRCLTEFLCTDSAYAGRRHSRRFCQFDAPHTARTGMQHACAQRHAHARAHAHVREHHATPAPAWRAACKQDKQATTSTNAPRRHNMLSRWRAGCVCTLRRDVHVLLLETSRGRTST